ncbi:MAG: FAD:protein FMN transferase [Solirubrobacteraceae bacterium]
MTTELDYTFRAMGSDVRLLIGPALAPGCPEPLVAADRERDFVLDFGRRLSRFRADSELSALNADSRQVVPASPLLRAAVAAGLWAAQRSQGLVDPTLVREIESAGYVTSSEDREPASLAEALAGAPVRRPAQSRPRPQWGEITVDDAAGTVSRPPRTMIDTGGTGKGLCADAVAHRLGSYSRVLVDCGGDIAVGGVGAQLEPYRIGVEHPGSGETIGWIDVARGGVATSGLNVNIWRDALGGFAHHLLDPSSGRPAWTGLVAATAVSPGGALEAETLSKMALLLGPDGARDVLAEHGGVIVHDSGQPEVVGPLAFQFSAAYPPAAVLV